MHSACKIINLPKCNKGCENIHCFRNLRLLRQIKTVWRNNDLDGRDIFSFGLCGHSTLSVSKVKGRTKNKSHPSAETFLISMLKRITVSCAFIFRTSPILSPRPPPHVSTKPVLSGAHESCRLYSGGTHLSVCTSNPSPVGFCVKFQT